MARPLSPLAVGIDHGKFVKRDVDDGVSDEVAVRRKQEALLDDAIALLDACKRHMADPVLGCMARTPDDRIRVQAGWHEHFDALNAVDKNIANGMLAPGDIVSKAICASLCAEEPAHELDVDEDVATTVLVTNARMVVVSCQHTAESRAYWPSAEEWHALRTRIARVVTRHFGGTPADLSALAERLTERHGPTDPENAFKRYDMARVLPPDLRRAYEERRIPASLAAEHEKARIKAAFDAQNGVRGHASDGSGVIPEPSETWSVNSFHLRRVSCTRSNVTMRSSQGTPCLRPTAASPSRRVSVSSGGCRRARRPVTVTHSMHPSGSSYTRMHGRSVLPRDASATHRDATTSRIHSSC
jgi:hypothetical protein